MFKIYNPSAISGVDNKSFYRQLDVWRALAAIWVVMDHACSTVVNDTSVIKDSKLFVTKPYIAFSLSGQLGVIMFFVISGYCIVFAADNCIKKNKTYKEFLRARLWRIFPPYYASIALGVALTLCFLISSKIGLIPLPNHSQNIFHNSLTYYLVNLTLTQEIFSVEPIQAIYWSLCYEVAFYFIIAVSILLHIKAKVNFYDLIFGLTHLSLLWLIFSPETCPFPVNLWYLFGLGAMVHMMIAQPTNVRIKW